MNKTLLSFPTRCFRLAATSLIALLWYSSSIGQSLTASLQHQTPYDNLLAQDEKKIKSLSEVLQMIEQQHGINITYQSDLLDKKYLAASEATSLLGASETDLDEALRGMMQSYGLDVKKYSESLYIIVQPKIALSKVIRESLNHPEEQALPDAPKKVSGRANTRFEANYDQTITGQVTDLSTDESLPGVNIVAKGTTTGTVTDIDGNYRLTVPDDAETLVFSSVGYEKEEVAISGRSVINMSMAPDIQSLSEVVVVGYGTQKKEDLTGSVSSINASEAIEKQAVQSFEQALQGRAAGVQVKQTTGAPGGGLSVRVRGVGSITTSAEPLYVVDGVPISGSNDVPGDGFRGGAPDQNVLSTLNPNDIQSIEILKDASATAIYGSRAANGVVLITTKSGKVGQNNINFSTYQGWSTLINPYEMANAQQYAIMVEEDRDFRDRTSIYSQRAIDSLANVEGTDWLDEISRVGRVQNYNLAVSGGDEDTKYFISGDYFGEDGIIKSSDFDRYSTRLNLTQTINKFQVGTNLTLSRSQSDRVPADRGFDNGGSVIARAIFQPPTVEPIRPDGTYETTEPDGSNDLYNPVQVINETYDRLTSDRVLGTLFAEYEFFEGLSFKVLGGIDYTANLREVWQSPNSGVDFGQPLNGRAARNEATSLSLINTNQLNYSKTLGDLHHLNTTLVFENQIFFNEFSQISVQDFLTDATGAENIGAVGGVDFPPNVFSGNSQSQLRSYLARINYDYDNRYLLTVSARADGTSKFSDDNRYGLFYSGALAWRIKEEAFLQDNELISNLKLRVSYGQTGNQDIGNYQTVQNYQFGAAAVLDGNNTVQRGAVASNFPNPDLKWETSTQLDIGVDLGLFDERISLTADYFVKKTDDLLYNVRLPSSVGFNTVAANVASMENRGIELSLNAVPVRTEDLQWTIGANLTSIRNEVTSLGRFGEFFGGNIQASGDGDGNLVRVGETLGAFYGVPLQDDGIFNSQEEIDAYAQEVPTFADRNRKVILGSIKYRDVNGDGDITPEDRVVLGSALPDFTYGLNTTVSYKGVTLDLLFDGSQGNEILNFLRIRTRNTSTTENKELDRYLDRVVVDSPVEGVEDNLDGSFPRIGSGIGDYRINRQPTEGLLEDGSFFRLRNLRLAYDLPLRNWGVSGLKRLNVYATGQNLLIITNYTGFNPDVSSFGQNAINQGIDVGGYPLSRIYTVGISIGL